MVAIKMHATVRIAELMGAAQGGAAFWCDPHARERFDGARTLPATPVVPSVGRTRTNRLGRPGPAKRRWAGISGQDGAAGCDGPERRTRRSRALSP